MYKQKLITFDQLYFGIEFCFIACSNKNEIRILDYNNTHNEQYCYVRTFLLYNYSMNIQLIKNKNKFVVWYYNYDLRELKEFGFYH